LHTSSAPYGEMEVGLHRSQPDSYDVELRVADPGTAGEVAPARGQARISLDELLVLEDSAADYGRALSDQVFKDPQIREFYLKNRASFDSRGLMQRLRILIGHSVPELHSLRWELLCDPETKMPLATSERILFSRFMLSRDWRVVKLRPEGKWKALVAVAAPSDITGWGMAAVDAAGEVNRARQGLAGIQVNVLGQDQPLTLDALMECIRQGAHILYLVCHGAMPKGQEPCLFLQTREGKTAPVPASALSQRIGELQDVQSLAVLASCESAGRVGRAHSALAPLLAEAGVPAVLAMQGKITMETVKQAMPVFFRELVKDGQIDRAIAVARGVVRERDDSWMPALFLRLKSGRLWHEADSAHPSTEYDSKTLAAVEHRLAQWLGPIAGAVVRKHSTATGSLPELCSVLAGQIASEKDRRSFLLACRKEFGWQARAENVEDTVSESPPVAARAIDFDPAFLERSKKQLACYLGPLAKVMVERAAKRAGSVDEFITLLSAQIPSAFERERFIAAVRAAVRG